MVWMSSGREAGAGAGGWMLSDGMAEIPTYLLKTCVSERQKLAEKIRVTIAELAHHSCQYYLSSDRAHVEWCTLRLLSPWIISRKQPCLTSAPQREHPLVRQGIGRILYSIGILEGILWTHHKHIFVGR